jgi:hypothetical protein
LCKCTVLKYGDGKVWRRSVGLIVCKKIGHTLPRNRLLKHVLERNMKGKIYGKTRRGRRGKLLLDDLKG